MNGRFAIDALRRGIVWAALVGAIGSAAMQVVWAAPDAGFESAFQLFMRASGGDDAAIDKAAESFDVLRKADPANPVATAYDGAATAMKAKAALLPWKKMGYAEDGLALIDKSLAMLTPAHDAALQHGTPGSLEVRFVAANTFLGVPDFMNGGARGAKLLGDVLASPLLSAAPLAFQGTVWNARRRPRDAAEAPRRRAPLSRCRRLARRAAGRAGAGAVEGSGGMSALLDEVPVAAARTCVAELRGVHKTYRLGQHVIPALRGVDLVVRSGELLALTGPSGSGKSTILNLAGLIDRPDAGDVLLAGRSVNTLDETGRTCCAATRSASSSRTSISCR